MSTEPTSTRNESAPAVQDRSSGDAERLPPRSRSKKLSVKSEPYVLEPSPGDAPRLSSPDASAEAQTETADQGKANQTAVDTVSSPPEMTTTVIDTAPAQAPVPLDPIVAPATGSSKVEMTETNQGITDAVPVDVIPPCATPAIDEDDEHKQARSTDKLLAQVIDSLRPEVELRSQPKHNPNPLENLVKTSGRLIMFGLATPFIVFSNVQGSNKLLCESAEEVKQVEGVVARLFHSVIELPQIFLASVMNFNIAGTEAYRSAFGQDV